MVNSALFCIVRLSFCFVFCSKTRLWIFYNSKNRSTVKTFIRDLDENLNKEYASTFVCGNFGSTDVMKDERRLVRSCQLAGTVQVLLVSAAC